MRLLLALLVAALPHPVPAETGPSFDCARADGAVETMICTDPGLAGADRRLDAVYASAVAAAQSLDVGAEDAAATLRAEQRGWIKGRNDCWKAADLRECVADNYARREGELVAIWMLADPVATRRFTCEGNPANKVFVMYFDLPTPAIRVEYGDGIDAMIRSPSASGARYEGSLGRMFWEKGDTALFAWTEGAEQSCTASG